MLRRLALTLLAALAARGSALQVVGTAPPWGDVGSGIEYRQLPSFDALRELYAGRADVALVTLPSPPPPKGVGDVLWLPVGVFAARLAYNLPGVELRLTLETACRIFRGEVKLWSDPVVTALNPGTKLPDLPILTTARTVPNSASLVFADACFALGVWPPKWRKSNWGANATFTRGTRREQLEDLKLTGSLGVLGVKEAPGTQFARLGEGEDFLPPALDLGFTRTGQLPATPWERLRLSGPNAYPLRGLVWAAVLREQKYRGRTVEQAREVADFLRALQAAESDDFAPLPENVRPQIELRFGEQPLPEATGR